MKLSELKKLYDLCPPFPTCKKCGDCCGPIIFTKKEALIMQEYISTHDIKYPKPTDDYCPMRIGGECLIYEARPVACRIFGNMIPMLICPNVESSKIIAGKEFWTILKKYHEYARSCLKFHSFHEKDVVDKDRAFNLNMLNQRKLRREHFQSIIQQYGKGEASGTGN